VWTVSHSGHGEGGSHKRRLMSRRPQRSFRVRPSPSHICCDLSWHTGVLVCTSNNTLSLFSIERNERVRSVDLADDLAPVANSLQHSPSSLLVKAIHLSDEGFIVCSCVLQDDSVVPIRQTFFLCAYTIQGTRSSLSVLLSPPTFLSIPSRGPSVICGSMDGKVSIYSVFTLSLVWSYAPHTSCLSGQGEGNKALLSVRVDESPVICVRVGPNPLKPAVICMTTDAGSIFIRALPDFIKWEKSCNQRTLSQMVQAPLQVLRGTMQQAHDMTMVAGEAAGALAANAKIFADETLSKVR
jgi:WD40 repeat protein